MGAGKGESIIYSGVCSAHIFYLLFMIHFKSYQCAHHSRAGSTWLFRVLLGNEAPVAAITYSLYSLTS